jgi:heme exporter protein D
MGVVHCPRCHGVAASAAGQAFCARCGWNRNVAILQVRSLHRLLPILLLPLVAYGLLLVARAGDWEPFLYVFLLGVGLCLLGVWWLGRLLERLEHVQPLDPERVKQARLADPEKEEEARSQAMLAVGRPRPVQLISTGRFYLAVLTGIVLAVEVMLLRYLVKTIVAEGSMAEFSAWNWIAAAGAVALLVVLVAIPLRLRRQKRLLENGEVALGRVTRQWKAGGNSWIQYEVNLGGATLRKKSHDPSHRLYTGMKVPIFYDAEDLSRQVPCCAAYYEVVLPQKE